MNHLFKLNKWGCRRRYRLQQSLNFFIFYTIVSHRHCEAQCAEAIQNDTLVFIQTFHQSLAFGVWIASGFTLAMTKEGHVCSATTKATNGRHYKVKLSQSRSKRESCVRIRKMLDSGSGAPTANSCR